MCIVPVLQKGVYIFQVVMAVMNVTKSSIFNKTLFFFVGLAFLTLVVVCYHKSHWTFLGNEK